MVEFWEVKNSHLVSWNQVCEYKEEKGLRLWGIPKGIEPSRLNGCGGFIWKITLHGIVLLEASTACTHIDGTPTDSRLYPWEVILEGSLLIRKNRFQPLYLLFYW